MMKNKIKTTVLALLLAASVAACKKKGGDSGGGGIGVPECDDYFARMDACSKKIDKTRGESLTKMANMMRPAWKEDAGDAEKKKALPDVCKQAVKDMAKQVPECDWGVAADTGSGSDMGSGDMGSGSAAGSDMGSGSAGSDSAGSAGSADPAGSAGSGSAAPAGSGSN